MTTMRNDQNGTVIIYLCIDDMLCKGGKKAIDMFKKKINEHFLTMEEGKVDDYVECMIKRINGSKKSSFNLNQK